MDSNSTTKILAADTTENVNLLQEALKENVKNFLLDKVSRLSDVISYLNQNKAFLPSLIIVGSGFLIHEGNDTILEIKAEGTYHELPVIILTEFEEENYLIPEDIKNLMFIKRPFSYEQMPHMIKTIFEATRNMNLRIK